MSIAQLDLGTTAQFIRTYMGPSLGWQLLPVMPELDVLSAAPLVLPPFASRIILKAAVKAIALRSVAAWVVAPPQQNNTAFDRSIWIKDLIGAASVAAPVVISPALSDTIDTQATFSIITPFDLIRLYPLSNLSGWWTG
jgi:hypothetical protein